MPKNIPTIFVVFGATGDLTQRKLLERTEREKQVALVVADQEAQEQAIGIRVSAQAEKDAAENHAQAVKIRAEAQQVQYKVEASGIEMRNAALNTLAAEQIAMQVKMKLLEALPAIIEASVKPMEKIDGIKIIQVDGLNRGAAGPSAATGSTSGSSGTSRSSSCRICRSTTS